MLLRPSGHPVSRLLFFKNSDCHLHVAEGNLSQQQEADGVWLGGVTVVCTLGHHVGEVHTFAEHVTGLEDKKQNGNVTQGRNILKTWQNIRNYECKKQIPLITFCHLLNDYILSKSKNTLGPYIRRLVAISIFFSLLLWLIK